MLQTYSTVAAVLSLATSVAAHGFITSPSPRLPGDGLKAACGDQVYNNQASDHFGNVQGSIQNLQGSHPDCRMWQCKGVPFADAAEVFSYTAGQVIPMTIDIRAPHSGVANVSIVKTSTDTVIGTALKSWDEYALTSSPMSSHPDWTSFDITMPDVSSECSKAGDCVIQWYWDAPDINQTYEACIDFTMGGGSSNSTPVESAAPTSTAAPATSKVPTSTAAPAASAVASPVVTPEATPVSSSAPSSTATPGSTLPETFTIETFIAWLQKTAGTDVADKLRRMMLAKREHARAFVV